MTDRPSCAVILNAGAGTVKARPDVDAELKKLFHAVGCDVEIVVARSAENLTDVARDAAQRFPIVVAAGGDGTISGVAAAIMDSPAALGVLPLGSRNHFAKDLRIPLDLPEAVALIAAPRIGRVDVGLVNDRVFINNSSIGIYPGIVEAREELRAQGHRKWPAMMIAAWQTWRSDPGMTVRLDADGQARTWRTPFVFVGNNEYVIDGVRAGGREQLDAGRLFAYVTPHTRTRDLPLLMVKSMIGRAAQSGAFEIVPATELTIRTRWAMRVRVSIDGEIAMMRQPLRYRVTPGGLRVVMPRD